MTLSADDIRSDRVQIQFRLGRAIVERIEAAADKEGLTRNEWLCQAALNKLSGIGEPGAFSAKEIEANRVPLLFRVGRAVQEAIDADYQKEGISCRTSWLLDAILAGLVLSEKSTTPKRRAKTPEEHMAQAGLTRIGAKGKRAKKSATAKKKTSKETSKAAAKKSRKKSSKAS